MGYRRSYSVTEAAKHINAASYEATNSHNDGFVAWGAKQDLYRLKWILEEALRRCPNFSLEDEWLKEQEQKKLIDYLKK